MPRHFSSAGAASPFRSEEFRRRARSADGVSPVALPDQHACLAPRARARERPELYVHGSDDDLAREPDNYWRLRTRTGARVLAHGRDPYFSGWSDTAQLNYRHPWLRKAMREVLETIGDQCDGVRCDMAMLVLPDVFARTWGDRARPADGTPPSDDPFCPAPLAGVRA